MKKVTQVVVCLSLLLGMASCRNENGKSEVSDIVRINLDWDAVVERFDYAPLVEDTALVIPLETTDDCLIGEITKLIYQDGRIYIGDAMSKSVFVFDESGKFLSKVRAVGNGPGEYVNITSFVVKERNILVYDHMMRRLLEYTADGKHLSTKNVSQIWGNELLLLGKKLFLMNAASSSRMGFYHLFSIYEEGEEPFTAYLPFGDFGEQGWSVDNYVAPLDEQEALIYYFPFDTLHTVRADGTASPSYVVDFGKKRLPQRYMEMDGEQAMKTAHRDNYVMGLEYVQQSDRYIFLQFADAKESYDALYDKQTGETILAKLFSNSLLGNVGLSGNNFVVQDNHIIFYRPILSWNHELLLSGEEVKDARKYYSDDIKRLVDTFYEMDGTECNPVIFIQKLK